MINEIATISVLDNAIQMLDEGKPRYEIKDSLVEHRDKLQKDVDQFDEWAKVQSDIDIALQLEQEEMVGK